MPTSTTISTTATLLTTVTPSLSTTPVNMLATTVTTVDDIISNNISSTPQTSINNSCSTITSPTAVPTAVAAAAAVSSVATSQSSTVASTIIATTSPSSVESIIDVGANSCNNLSTPPAICISVGQTVTTDDIITSIAATSILNGAANNSNNVAGLLESEIKNQTQQQLQQSPIDQNKVGDLNLSASSNTALANILLSPGTSGPNFLSNHPDQCASMGNATSPSSATSTLWSTADDGNHMSINGFGNFQNFSTPPLFNGAAAVAASLAHQQRRAITASQAGNFHHGLSPNRSAQLLQNQHSPSAQQNQQQQQSQQNMFKNPYSSWTSSAAAAAAAAAAAQSVAWPPPQQQQNQSQNNIAQWNRGRSVPNLNPLTAGGTGVGMPQRKPTSPNPGPSQSSPFSASHAGIAGISPLKYRRSTSFPGKGPSPTAGGYPLDVPTIDDGRDPFMAYQRHPCNYYTIKMMCT